MFLFTSKFITQNGYTAQCSIVVQTSIKTIRITNEGEIALNGLGSTTKIDVTVTPFTTTEKIVWKSSNENVAKVDKNGTVTAIGSGKVTITVQNSSGNVKASINVTVTDVDSFNDEFYTLNGHSKGWMTIGSEKTISSQGKMISKIEGSASFWFIKRPWGIYAGLAIDVYDGTNWETLWDSYKNFDFNLGAPNREHSASVSKTINNNKLYKKIRGRLYLGSDIWSVR